MYVLGTEYMSTCIVLLHARPVLDMKDGVLKSTTTPTTT